MAGADYLRRLQAEQSLAEEKEITPEIGSVTKWLNSMSEPPDLESVLDECLDNMPLTSEETPEPMGTINIAKPVQASAKGKMTAHLSNIHIRCKICDVTFADSISLENHVTSTHNEVINQDNTSSRKQIAPMMASVAKWLNSKKS